MPRTKNRKSKGKDNGEAKGTTGQASQDGGQGLGGTERRPAKRLKTSGPDDNAPVQSAGGTASVDVSSEKKTDKPTKSRYLEASTLAQAGDPVEEALSGDEASTAVAHPELAKSANLLTINIISSSQIQKKVTSMLSHLSRFSFATPAAKPGLIVVQAKASAASKAISIVEIAKREVAKQGAKWYQYSALGETMGTVPRQKKAKHDASGTSENAELQEQQGPKGDKVTEDHEMKDAKVLSDDDDDDDDDEFEEMEGPRVPQTGVNGMGALSHEKIRAVPILTIHLSMVRVEQLKKLYG